MLKTSSSKQATALRQASHRYKIFADELSVADKRISEEVAEELKSEIIKLYHDFVSTKVPAGDPQDRGEITVWIIQEENGRYRVGVTGDEVIYDEFGTGQEGYDNPHPDKSRYAIPLDPYMSGPVVKSHINDEGRHYWFYDNVYTEGVPSGHFIYDATMNVADYEAAKIAKKVIKDIKKKSKGK